MLANFVRMEFENASSDYNYTICPYNDINTYLEAAADDFELATQAEVDKKEAVKITITPLPGYTEEMWGAWLEALPK